MKLQSQSKIWHRDLNNITKYDQGTTVIVAFLENKTFWAKKDLGPQNFWSKIDFWSTINLGSKTIFGST